MDYLKALIIIMCTFASTSYVSTRIFNKKLTKDLTKIMKPIKSQGTVSILSSIYKTLRFKNTHIILENIVSF